MVLEHIVPEDWLEKKGFYAFLLGGFYSIIGIVLARLLFASDPALPAVAFTSLLILPELYSLFTIEEREQRTDKRTGIGVVWRNNRDFFAVLLTMFLGILLVYSVAAMILPNLTVNTLFREQLAMRAVSGHATMGGQFWALLANNAGVLAAVFFVALLSGDGAIFLITWNASLWGAIFGITARAAASVAHVEPLVYFFQILLTVTPHMLLEASAYILAAMAGGLLSRAFLREGLSGKALGRVFGDNATIFLLALVALVLGAGVESYVLSTSANYAHIVQLALRAH